MVSFVHGLVYRCFSVGGPLEMHVIYENETVTDIDEVFFEDGDDFFVDGFIVRRR
jgi:hypothetical protein